MYNINHVELYGDTKEADFKFSYTILLILVGFPEGNPPKYIPFKKKEKPEKIKLGKDTIERKKKELEARHGIKHTQAHIHNVS